MAKDVGAQTSTGIELRVHITAEAVSALQSLLEDHAAQQTSLTVIIGTQDTVLRPRRTHTLEEAAEIIGGNCKASTLRRLARERKIPSVKIGGAYNFTSADIDEIIAFCKTPARAACHTAVPAKRTPAKPTAGPATPLPGSGVQLHARLPRQRNLKGRLDVSLPGAVVPIRLNRATVDDPRAEAEASPCASAARAGAAVAGAGAARLGGRDEDEQRPERC